ncbi:putative knottin, scorpion toxin [Medicago truncatula]|uniref:Defensin-like protein n=1 Tax=Medicago truncatula TaxID=3880 RepID=A0A072TLR3_MEDTR|nr:Defensin-like protein [Medicago truncatula]RHN39055.1 putative knottin, scorpion toxin [Medicago truncatula]
MASSSPKLFTIFLFLILVVLLFSTSEVQAKLCRGRSKLWSGPCINSKCKRQCINVERAVSGGCHLDNTGVFCFCDFKC